ncbi:MAG TPA: phosphoribosyltransferase [Solirubrobacteraceae bacterium]|nr:phosphoribosyltransferase [Solirubrobacteraceae bacterium]
MSERSRFADRHDAGRRLAESLGRYAGRDDVIVLGLPRGGVPVAFEVARALRAPLDVFLVRKLGVPGHEELAMGAIASGGVQVLNDDVLAAARVPPEAVERVAARELDRIREQERAYRGERAPLEARGRIAIVVDDGLATGATMRAAVEALRDRGAGSIVVAVPTAPIETCEALRREADEVVCARTPDPFTAVGMWYRDFAPVSDQEVAELLAPSAGPS